MTRENDGKVTLSDTPRKSFSRSFWVTIFTILGITLLLSLLSSSRDFSSSSGSTSVATPRQYEIQSSVLRELLSSSIAEAALATTGSNFIESGVDIVYEPVYAAVSAYADYHYSVIGSYTELIAGAVGDPVREIEERLFAGFDQRMTGLTSDIDARFHAEVARIFDSKVDEELPEGVTRSNLSDVTEAIIQDTFERVAASSPVSALAAGVVGSQVAAKKVSANFLGALAAKATAKLAAKAGTSVLGGAAAGATAGAALGPVGAIAGGVLTGAAIWLGVDAIFVGLDEYFNREEFEADLVAMITASKEETKAELLRAVGAKAQELE